MRINVRKLLVSVFCLSLIVFNTMSAYCNEFDSLDAVVKELESNKQVELEKLRGMLSRGEIYEPTYKSLALKHETLADYQVDLLKKVAQGAMTGDELNQKMTAYFDAENTHDEKNNQLISQLKSEKTAGTEINRRIYEKDLEFYSQYSPAKQVTALGNTNIPVSAAKNALSSAPSERLKKLKSLLDQGLITQKDYDTQREAIIKSL